MKLVSLAQSHIFSQDIFGITPAYLSISHEVIFGNTQGLTKRIVGRAEQKCFHSDTFLSSCRQCFFIFLDCSETKWVNLAELDF